MKIIHTADWHLGHRLGRIDRADDIRRAVGRVVDVCLRERADVLLICGDLFHDVGRAEVLRESVQHLCEVLGPFFAAGGTALAITGNHDKEHLASTLQQAMRLAAPADTRPGDELRPGRFYLFPGPTFFRLPDAQAPGAHVQFVMLPYPTATRYLDEPNQRFTSTEERNRAVRSAFTRRLGSIRAHPAFDKRLQTVLAAHIITRGAEVRDGFGLSEADAVVLDDADLLLSHRRTKRLMRRKSTLGWNGAFLRWRVTGGHFRRRIQGPDSSKLSREMSRFWAGRT